MVYPSVPREVGAVFRFVGVVAMLVGVRFGVCVLCCNALMFLRFPFSAIPMF